MRAVVVTLVVLAGLGWLPAVPGGGLAAAAPMPANLHADNIQVDNRGTTLSATGHVTVAYGALHVASDALRIDRPAGTATFTGSVVVRDEKGRASAHTATLSVANESRVTRVVLTGAASVETRSYALLADRIEADRQRNRLIAVGHVTAFSQPDLIARGALLTYDEGGQRGEIRGDGTAQAAIQNRDGRIQGTWIELSRKTGQAIVHGPVAAEIYDATLTGADAAIDLDRGIAVFTGHVTITRRLGTLLADRLTVHYRARRFIAEGTTHMTFRDLDESPAP